ncbi:MAG: PAS domain S-box protein, partial [Polyangia bacterium]
SRAAAESTTPARLPPIDDPVPRDVMQSDDDIAKILIVDDHRENILALDGILARPGIEILSAPSGVDALRLVLKHDFAVILMDVLMPTMDGFETASLIRTREASKHTPIIFLTAAGFDVDMVDRGYAVGAVDYLVKPLNPDVVTAKVAVFVDLFQKSRRIHRQEEALRAAERERGEAALKESYALYEASFNAAPVGIALTAADGRWLRMNPRFCQITGYSREEALELRFQDITHPDDVASEVAAFKQLIAREIDTYHREKRYLHKEGHTVWVDLTVSLLRDPAGRPKHFIKVVEDITERRRAEERQRLLAGASQILLRSLDRRATLDDVAQLAVSSLCDWCMIATTTGGDNPGYEVAIVHADPTLKSTTREFRQRVLGVPNLAEILARNQPQTTADFAALAADSWKLDYRGGRRYTAWELGPPWWCPCPCANRCWDRSCWWPAARRASSVPEIWRRRRTWRSGCRWGLRTRASITRPRRP